MKQQGKHQVPARGYGLVVALLVGATIGVMGTMAVAGESATLSRPAATELAATCFDIPFDWKDKDGFSCSDYADKGLCKIEPPHTGPNWIPGASYDDYAVEGMNALQACCVCGGGDQRP